MTNRRNFLKTSSAWGAAAALGPSLYTAPAAAASEIEVGVLFSLSGGLSMVEKSLADATLMATLGAANPDVMAARRQLSTLLFS